MMDFEEFKREIKKELEKIVGIGKVEVRNIRKNNGTCLTGLMILGPIINLTPIIYLEEYYQKLQHKTLSEITDEICECYLENTLNGKTDVSRLTKWEYAKSRIVLKLINYAANEELLQQVPHEKFLNMAVVYQYILHIDEEGQAAFLINDQHLVMWKVGKTALKEVAYKNYKNFYPTVISNMEDVISEIFGQMPSDWTDGAEYPQLPLYIVTNQTKMYGAAVMLFPEELKILSDKWQTDLYILPSSVHEILVLPAKNDDAAELKGMVCEVNETTLEKMDWLSDSVYYYSRESGKICIALE